MPEYLAPGVYVEEVSFRSKSIEGVSTTTTGFIGPTLYGPINLVPELLTSLADFERTYGGLPQLEFINSDGSSTTVMDNYMAHGVRAFFEQGGTSCYVVRTFKPMSSDPAYKNPPQPYKYPPEDYISAQDDAIPKPAGPQSLYLDGHARATLHDNLTVPNVHIRARFPGVLGNMRVRFTVRMGQNILTGKPATATTKALPSVGALLPNDIVWISSKSKTPNPSDFGIIGSGALHVAQPYTDPQTRAQTWKFDTLSANMSPIQSEEVYLQDLTPGTTDAIRPITLTVTVIPDDPVSLPTVWSNLPLDPSHESNGTPDSLFDVFGEEPSDTSLASTMPIVIEKGEDGVTGLDVLYGIFAASRDLIAAQPDNTKQDVQTQLGNLISTDVQTRAKSTDLARSVDVVLTGGNDGMRPGAGEYEGTTEENSDPGLNPKPFKTGLEAFKDLEDISILAAPGATFGYEKNFQLDAQTINGLLIDYATQMNLIAIIDSGDNQSTTQVRAMRAQIDSTHAAFYYPWVLILDPVTRTARAMPPSGFVAGIYVRNDLNRAVFKAPANEVVSLALGFEKTINKAQQDVLNIEGINCFRYFEGRGYLLWGARTVSSDPEWKYVNLRRYFVYLERSIDRGTQWAVFEPNGEALWGNVRRTIDDFLLNEFRSGALLGAKPEQAYFVRCDRSTMTQNDIDNGRLVCLIGVAVLRPAEFVIFRIGQWTAS